PIVFIDLFTNNKFLFLHWPVIINKKRKSPLGDFTMGSMLINVSGQNNTRGITDLITEENAGNSYSALQ
ncbi:hypothetical protein, partial [Serratia marcescens]|uniref:hypothetical protein n=1 Tax=Serratia marcescens TaxID=615 RepID=UPI001952B4F6